MNFLPDVGNYDYLDNTYIDCPADSMSYIYFDVEHPDSYYYSQGGSFPC